jgi:hypothetical protein
MSDSRAFRPSFFSLLLFPPRFSTEPCKNCPSLYPVRRGSRASSTAPPPTTATISPSAMRPSANSCGGSREGLAHPPCMQPRPCVIFAHCFSSQQQKQCPACRREWLAIVSSKAMPPSSDCIIVSPLSHHPHIVFEDAAETSSLWTVYCLEINPPRTHWSLPPSSCSAFLSFSPARSITHSCTPRTLTLSLTHTHYVSLLQAGAQARAVCRPAAHPRFGLRVSV